jgi:phospholipid transport system substrate-binding protein
VNETLKKLVMLTLSLLIFGIGGVNASQVQANVAPTAVVEQLFDTVRKIKKPDAENNVTLTPEEEKQNNELSRQVDRMLDIEAISAYALWEHWNSRNPQEKKNFVATFTELLEKVAYTNTGKFLKDLAVSVHKEKVISDKAMVYTSIVHEKEGRVDIDFKLHQAGSSWVVEDVMLDGVSLARNLRTQCQKIIRENSFQELVSRMRKKIVERNADDLKEVSGREWRE